MIELPVIDSADKESEQPRERFWRSFAQLEKENEYRSTHSEELMEGASEAPEGSSRRQFLQIMGASMALAGLAACRRPEEKILPYATRPEEIVPGVPLYYATALPFRGTYRGVLVESHEGRPTKIEGNPEHSGSRGATSPFEQAALLNLYDPDRSKTVLRERAEAGWGDFVRLVEDLHSRGSALRLIVVGEPNSSPTLRRLRTQFLSRFPASRWITYSDEGDDSGALALQAAGGVVRPNHDFENARVILGLDADFLGPTERNFLHNSRSFAAGRRLAAQSDDMSRLYVVEPSYTMTGGMADHRLKLRSSDIPAFASSLARALGLDGSVSADTRFDGHLFVNALAEDMRRSGGRSVVVVGESQPPAVHSLVASINAAVGQMVAQYVTTDEDPVRPQAAELVDLAAQIRAGQVDALLFLGSNPVHSAPAELGLEELIRQVPLTIHHGLHVDETAQLCTWHLPAAHPLEAWGDGRAYDGLTSIVQPLIAPLYGAAHSEIELVNLLATGTDADGYELVRSTWQDRGEEGWRQALHDGVIPGTEYPTTGTAAGAAAETLPAAQNDAIELVVGLDPTVLDGRFANNAWMQELPDPTTKVVWDNVATMSQATADRLGVSVEYDAGKFYADIVEIGAGPTRVRLPVWIMPGQAENSVGVTLGYGRNIASSREHRRHSFFNTEVKTDIYSSGPLANGVGSNVGPLRNAAFSSVRVGDVQVEATGERMLVATTQEHGSMEGRPLARFATLEEFKQQPRFAEEQVEVIAGADSWEEYPELWHENHPRNDPRYKDSPYAKHQWGMVIDLNTCIGCNACIVACDSENNIQMVGKDQVSRGRELHWLRVDRYYVTPAHRTEARDAGMIGEGESDHDDVQMLMQPLPCMHCENAPCEAVCPVAATVRSSDGLNSMIYNRCIGTRYCSNNCPYKVRRFNYYNWSKTIPTQVQMAQNPNVTIRFRGVMEKCTFCVQRIREANRREIVEGRPIEDGDVQTACQQACPTDAIVFGDLADPGSSVSQLRRNPRRYELLAELNTKPRTSYLARVRNPNPQLGERA